MKKFIESIRQKYAAFETRTLEKLPPDQREDVRAFDAMWQRNKWKWTAIGVVVWIAAAALLRLGKEQIGWVEALFLTFLIIGGPGIAALSAWFGHGKFKLSAKWGLIMVLLTVAGALVGGLLGAFLKGGSAGLAADFVRVGPKVIIGGLVAGVIYSLMLMVIVQTRRKQLQSRNLQLEQQAKEERLARQLADAKLKLLQAQVEPHFLFNTLASVQHLAEGRAPEAAQLTRELIAFFRAGLAGLREETTTLKLEFEMAAAFLSIMKTRMGARLQFSLDLPEILVDRRVPPAMLISLVENAIKHGVEPAADGGTIHIFARETDGRLQFGVTDSGLGLLQNTTAVAGGGVGLANIRERLLAIFGDKANMTIEQSPPHGVAAIITIEQTAEVKE